MGELSKIGMELREVRKSFGNLEVIHGVDLSVDEGDFVVFVGPSGCGKSTLLRMIAGLEEVTDGIIEIRGRDVTDVDPSSRGIAMVFQTYALYPHMSVRDNLAFGLKMAKLPPAEIARRVDDAARILQLDQLMDRRPGQMSGGQRQRVAIGRAIVREPDVFLFDEPLSNLDAELRVSMRIEIARLHRELGNTMIYVTHDQVEAMTLADKIVVLRDGRIEQVGSPEEVYEDPVNTFVAGFIGSPRMNLLDGEWRGDGVIGLGEDVGATPLTPSGIRVGDPLKLGLRPEHLVVGSAETGLVKARVDFAEYLGGTRFLHCRLSDGQSLVAEHRGGVRVVPGDIVGFDCAPERLRLFDADGVRLR